MWRIKILFPTSVNTDASGIPCHDVHFQGHFGAAAAAATAASDPNQSFQGRVWTLDSGWKHLVGFKYAGWWLLHRPKDGSLLHLRSLFVH